MKKLFTLWAAMSCMVGMMMADSFGDGFYISVGSVVMDPTTKTSVTSADAGSDIKSGTISYDATNHVLTLDNVEIEGKHAQRQLYISNSTSSNNITVKLKGANKISADSRCIWLWYLADAANKMVIMGDDDASLELTTGSSTVAALVASKDNGTPTTPYDKWYRKVTVTGGCTLIANAPNSQHAIECYTFELLASNLIATSTNKPVYTNKEFSTFLVKEIEKTDTRWEYQGPKEYYPVSVNGMILNDVMPSMDKTSGIEITDGSISYDPKTHVLTLDGVSLDANINNPALRINAAPGDTIYMRLKGTNTIRDKQSNSSGLVVNCPVVISSEGDPFNNQVTFGGTESGILIGGGSLHLRNAAYVKAEGTAFGVEGSKIDGKYPKLEIDGSGLSAYGKTDGSIYGVEAEVIESKLNDAGMSFADNTVKKSGSIVKNAYVDIVPTVTYCAINTQGKGKAYIMKDGVNMGSFIKLHGMTTITLKAEPAEGWHFGGWYDGSLISKELEFSATVGSVMLTAWAVFFKDAPSDAEWYVNEAKNLYVLSKDMTSKTKKVQMTGPPTSATNVVVMKQNGTDQVIQYSDEDSYTEVGVYKYSYNPGSGEASAVRAEQVAQQKKYYPITAMAYNPVNEYTYMAAYNTEGSAYQLCRLKDGSNTISSVATFPSPAAKASPIVGMVYDSEMNLYAIAKGSSDDNAWLYKVDVMAALLTPVMNTGLAYNNNYRTQALTKDIKTGTFVYMYEKDGSTWFYELDTEAGEANLMGRMLTYTHTGMYQWVGKLCTVEVGEKADQSERGRASLKGGDQLGYFYSGSDVVLKATPAEGCKFVRWSDGSTENPHKVTITTDARYEAEFAWEDGITAYPIRVCGKQMHSKRATFNSTNQAGKIIGGEISYDDATKVLTLKDLTMSISGTDMGIVIGEEDSSTELTIKITGSTANISGTSLYAYAMKIKNANVTIKGDKSLSIDVATEAVRLTKGAKLTLEGISGSLKGMYAVRSQNADDGDALVIRGSAVTLQGASKATRDIASVTWKYSKLKDTGVTYDTDAKAFKKGSADVAKVEFAVDGFTVRCTPAEEGTGNFTMRLADETGDTFENVGWFKSGAKIKINAYGADNYAFGYWTDDVEKESSREFTISADLNKEARFFRQVQSNATWYGIHDGKVASFTLYDGGKKVVNPQQAAAVSSVNGGDYCNGQWYLVESSSIKTWPFSGGFDKDSKLDTKTTAYITAGVPSGLTDYAYSIMGGEHYGVAAKKLYRINSIDKKMEEIGTMKNKYKEGEVEKEKEVSGIGIAFDAVGTLYVLSADGALYTMTGMDLGTGEVWLSIVGDAKNGGSIHETVNSGAQSLAFDHVTGELFWAGKDFIRQIDMSAMKCYKVADLGFKKGSAGVVKGMHRMDEMAYVVAQVADSCKEMGTVEVGDNGAAIKSEGYFIAGASVTVTATPAEGYKFVKWTRLEGKKEIDMKKEGEKNPLELDAYDASFVAYFEATGQGIEILDNGHWTMDNKKVLIDGTLYIIKGDKMYTITGNRIK